MSRLRVWLFIPIALVIILGALYVQPRLELYRLEHANPIQDARRAITRGDRRLAAVEMLGVTFPGADSILGREGAFQCEAWSVSRYTSDVVDDLTNSINGAAKNYAMTYNRELLRDGEGCSRVSKRAA